MNTPVSTETFDVVIVGAGGAGLAAAIEARGTGASVVLLEKNAKPGGTTAWSIGSVSATQTPHQRAKGIVDSPADHWADMPGFAGDLASRDNDELRRILCEGMPDTFQWLLDSGVRFMGPMPEPPHRQPRMHNVLPNSRSFIYHLSRRARRAGVQIRTGIDVRELLKRDDRVSGVRAEVDGRSRVFEARRGVVLAAGDFTNSPEFKARFMGEQEAKVDAVNPTATGDGQRMAERLGATIVNGDLALGPELRFIAPAKETFVRRLPPWRALAVFMQWAMDHMPPAILRPFVMKFLTTALAPSPALFEAGAVLVNREGARFCNEGERPAYALPDQPGKEGWIVFDGALAEQFSKWPHFVSTAPGVAYAYVPDYRQNRKDIYTEHPTIEGLAAALGMDAGTLRQSLSLRPPGAGTAARYIALGPVRPVFVHSEGGLRVDTQHRVLGQGNRPVPGLYAAGSTGQGGLLLKGHGHHLAWAFVSGRRAGRIVAGG
ncbi:FAD-dependent oxidoreductase [Variovorax sp. J2P1-59]|uniref:FAD-dependent oxidoreductase n=1 Tax=Variovorax flavidus TaxID=3053501 RepID=UPI002578D548|nr:FAD-dependent oxidoreductase [Variovorax sp. J2P1-59]MDM0074449.1 FAD-dependent oxidoreductase [Variovorax sp. J2P1-59]